MISVNNKKYAVVKDDQVKTEDILITKNGNYYPKDGVTGFELVRVQLPDPIYEELTINPSTTQQTFTSSKDGYSKVTAKPVTASIDSDIKPSNIVKGVNILGVVGNVEFVTEDLTINPSTNMQTFTPTKDGFKNIKVNAVTSSIDTNIKSKNIKKGVEVLGVVGNLIEANNTTRDIYTNGLYKVPSPYTGFSEVNVQVQVEQEPLEITPTTSTQTFTAPDMYHGYSPITVGAVTSSIDSNIKANNIRDGVSILGVNGTLKELLGEERTETLTSTDSKIITPSSGKNAMTKVTVSPNIQALTINPSTTKQVKNVPSGYSGYGTVTVNPVTADIDSNIVSANLKKGVTILGVTGTSEEVSTTTVKITENGTYTPKAPYNGYSKIEVDINTVNNTNITITDSGVYTPPSPYTGFEKVTVDLSWIENELKKLNAGDVATPVVLQNKTITQAGTYTCSSGYDGFGTITVDLAWVDKAIAEAKQGACTGTVDNLVSSSTVSIATDADSIRKYAFYYAQTQKVVLNNAKSIGEYAFANSGIKTLVINTTSVCSLGNNAFSGASPTSIKVPSNLVASYKAATNWSSYASIISAI